MKHYTEDQLLGYILETLLDSETDEISQHLKDCTNCQTICEKIQHDIDIISSVSPKEIQIKSTNRITSTFWQQLVRTAALVVFGFGIGYFAAGHNSDNKELKNIDSSYMQLKAAKLNQPGIAISDATGWRDTLISGGL